MLNRLGRGKVVAVLAAILVLTVIAASPVLAEKTETAKKKVVKFAKNADKLDGKDSTEFLGKTEKAADSDLLDGKDSTEFVPTNINSFLRNSVYKAESAIDAGTRLGDNTNVKAQACNAGDVLLSGGPANVSASSDLLESFPSPGSTTSWSARINDNGVADSFSVVVLCIDQ